jgi:hypothetical protein
VDVSATAREAGIRYPVALTRAVWERRVRVPDGVACQDEAGRLWDVLFLLALAARRSNGYEVRFAVHVRNSNDEGTPPLVRLKALCGPGDQGLQPVVSGAAEGDQSAPQVGVASGGVDPHRDKPGGSPHPLQPAAVRPREAQVNSGGCP